MTVLSLERLRARLRRPAAVNHSRRPAIVTHHLGEARCPAPPERRTYPDSFFADPAAVGRRRLPDAAPHPSRDTAIVQAS
jgi:hypothetical protein